MMSEVCCSDPFAFRPLRITTWPPRKSQQEKVSTKSSLGHIVCLVLSWTMLSQEINSMDKTVYSTDCSRKRKVQPKVLSHWHRWHFPKLLSSKTIKKLCFFHGTNTRADQIIYDLSCSNQSSVSKENIN